MHQCVSSLVQQLQGLNSRVQVTRSSYGRYVVRGKKDKELRNQIDGSVDKNSINTVTHRAKFLIKW